MVDIQCNIIRVSGFQITDQGQCQTKDHFNQAHTLIAI